MTTAQKAALDRYFDREQGLSLAAWNYLKLPKDMIVTLAGVRRLLAEREVRRAVTLAEVREGRLWCPERPAVLPDAA